MMAKISKRESKKRRKERAQRIVASLHELYPDATTALDHSSALELLAATVLSAQCTDVRVNMVTPPLFKRYPTAKHYAEAERGELERMIHSTGFYRNKAKSLMGLGKAIAEEHGGEVPQTMAELVALPGVGRKTANVVLANWFGVPGIAVDTHVTRLSGRLGLSQATDAVKIEHDLMELYPDAEWGFISHGLILHGRQVCAARKPKCEECGIEAECPQILPPKLRRR